MRVAHKILEVLQLSFRIGEIDVHPSGKHWHRILSVARHDARDAVAHADTAMYVAKQRGRKTVQCFAPQMDTLTQERVRLESDLHQALKRGQFELHYQPKVDAASGRFRGAERCFAGTPRARPDRAR